MELGTGDAHGAQRVLVWVEACNLRDGDGAAVDARVERERRACRQLRTGDATHHLTHEVRQRQVGGAGQLRSPCDRRDPDRLGRIGHRGAMRGLGHPQHRG